MHHVFDCGFNGFEDSGELIISRVRSPSARAREDARRYRRWPSVNPADVDHLPGLSNFTGLRCCYERRVKVFRMQKRDSPSRSLLEIGSEKHRSERQTSRQTISGAAPATNGNARQGHLAGAVMRWVKRKTCRLEWLSTQPLFTA
jgi:hypothetical protein